MIAVIFVYIFIAVLVATVSMLSFLLTSNEEEKAETARVFVWSWLWPRLLISAIAKVVRYHRESKEPEPQRDPAKEAALWETGNYVTLTKGQLDAFNKARGKK